jgi:hypothetical protein
VIVIVIEAVVRVVGRNARIDTSSKSVTAGIEEAGNGTDASKEQIGNVASVETNADTRRPAKALIAIGAQLQNRKRFDLVQNRKRFDLAVSKHPTFNLVVPKRPRRYRFLFCS